MSRNDETLIEQILEASRRAAADRSSRTRQIRSSWLVRSAAERQSEIIGEAAGYLSNQLRAAGPTFP